MKRKLIFAIIILALIAIIVVVLILTRDKGTEPFKFLEESGYPVTVADNGTELRVTLDGSKTADLSWSAAAQNETVVSVSQDGREKKGKATYVITPKVEGPTEIAFDRSGDDGTAVRIILPVIAYTEEDKLIIACADDAYIDELNEKGGTSESPYILENREDETAIITFPKGQGDWLFMDPDGVVKTASLVGSGGTDMVSVYQIRKTTEEETDSEADVENNTVQDGYYYELVQDEEGNVEYVRTEIPPAEPNYYDIQREKYKGHSSIAEDGSGTTLLLAVSESAQTTQFIDVKIDAYGKITLTQGKEPGN